MARYATAVVWLIALGLILLAIVLDSLGWRSVSAILRTAVGLLVLLPLAVFYVVKGVAELRSGAGNTVFARTLAWGLVTGSIAWNVAHATDGRFSPALSIASGVLLVSLALWKPRGQGAG